MAKHVQGGGTDSPRLPTDTPPPTPDSISHDGYTNTKTTNLMSHRCDKASPPMPAEPTNTIPSDAKDDSVPLSAMLAEAATPMDGIAMHVLGGTEAPPPTDTPPPTLILAMASRTTAVTRTLLGVRATIPINSQAPIPTDTPPPIPTDTPPPLVSEALTSSERGRLSRPRLEDSGAGTRSARPVLSPPEPGLARGRCLFG